MTAVFDKLGIRFLYPDNWTLSVEHAQSWPRSVSVQAPGGAFWSVAIHSPPADAEELAEVVLAAMREQYDDLETEAVSEQIAGIQATGYEMHFHCLDFIVAARLRILRVDRRSLVLLYQAEDREFDQFELVFQGITSSLLKVNQHSKA